MLRNFLRKHVILRRSLSRNYGELHSYIEPSRRKDTFERILRIKDENLLMTNSEAYQLYSLVKSVQKVEGDMAEVGVYKGRSARLILDAADYKKKIHLFDTFSGLPEPSAEDLKEHDFKKGDYFASKEEVVSYLKDLKEHVSIYEGVFPVTSDPVKEKTFSVVNIDVDLYSGTLEALKFFYPRMAKGGLLISHDYVSDGGVREAIQFFFKDKPEPVFEVGAGSQAFTIKL